MLLFLMALILRVSSSDSVNAIQDAWPFKIDFVLVEMDNVFLDGNPTSIDPGTHIIRYAERLSFVPDKILITMPKLYVAGNINRVNYRYLASNLSEVGFTLRTTFSVPSHQTVLLSYMTITHGYGLELYFLESSSFILQNIPAQPTYSFYVSSVDATENFVDPSKYFIAPFTPQLDITNFTSSKGYFVEKSVALNRIKITVQVPITTSLSSFTISVLVYFMETFNSTLSSFSFYSFHPRSIFNMTSATVIFDQTNNISSNIYFIGGIISGPIKNTFSMGHYLMDTPRPTVGVYNISYVSNRADSRNVIHSYISTSSTLANEFALLILFRSSCSNSEFPYLMMNKQRCYTLCPKQYYNDSNGRCNKCSGCSNIIDCDYCYYSMCADDEYYTHSPMACKKCHEIDVNCQKCFQGKCLVCSAISETVARNGECVTCGSGEYYDHQEMDCKVPGSFQLSAFVPKRETNQIHAFITFNTSLGDIQDRIRMKWFVNGQERNASLTYFYENNTIKSEITIDRSLNSPTVRVQIQPDAALRLEKTEDQQTVDNIYFIHPQQQALMDFIGQATGGISDNSGFILSTASLTSLSGYIVGILWNFQIASYYLFLPVAKPLNLFQLLNATTDILNINILPFSIPSPLDYDDTEVKGLEIYAQFGIDLYFMRASFQDIASLAVFSLFYYLLFLLFRKFQPQRFLTRFVKTKIVAQVYVNISMNFYSLITVLAFVGSTALTARNYIDIQLLFNNMTANYCLFLAFAFAIVHPIILFIRKQCQKWDLEDCYIGFKRQKRYSQIILTNYFLYQLLIPVVIPLFHPMFSILIIVISTISNIIVLIRVKPLKFHICTYYRLISQFTFLLFNLTFVAYYIIQNHFQKTNVVIIETIGYVSIGAMGLVIVLEMVEILTEMSIDFYYFIRRACRNKKIIDMKQRISMETTKSDSPTTVEPIIKLKRGKMRSKVQKPPSLFKHQNLPDKKLNSKEDKLSITHERSSRKQIIAAKNTVRFEDFQDDAKRKGHQVQSNSHEKSKKIYSKNRSSSRRNQYSIAQRRRQSEQISEQNKENKTEWLSQKIAKLL